MRDVSRPLHDFPGGLVLPGLREPAAGSPLRPASLPERIYLPLCQHIGLPARPLAVIGERVAKGQPLAVAEGPVSSSLHAPTSGRVLEITEHPLVLQRAGSSATLVLEPDGEERWCEPLPPLPADAPPEAIASRLAEAGVVGMGGAGFPSQVKLREGERAPVELLIVNGVECEPGLSCDDRLLRDRPQQVQEGARLLSRALEARHCVLAIEEDMEQAWESLQGADAAGVELVRVPARYPAGGERQLIRTLSGKWLRPGSLPIELGIVMYNVATAAAAAVAVFEGRPLISRIVTVAGEVPAPANLEVLIGTPAQSLLRDCGMTDPEGCEIRLGGAMMGIPAPSPQVPMLKSTGGIQVRCREPEREALPCIHCGECVPVCPASLRPQRLHELALQRDYDGIQDEHLFACIECGCCEAVCPSSIPLVAQYRQAKQAINELADAERRAHHARVRFLLRRRRLLRERQEREAGRETREAATGGEEESARRRREIREAIARRRARRRPPPPGEGGDD